MKSVIHDIFSEENVLYSAFSPREMSYEFKFMQQMQLDTAFSLRKLLYIVYKKCYTVHFLDFR